MKVTTPPVTIKETQEGLLKKDFSAVELVDAYLERIKKYDGSVNSFITVSDEVAYKQAKAVDSLIGELGNRSVEEKPLLGVVVAYKDIFLTKGVRTTAASKVLESYIPPYSATVVKKLTEAGAIMIGKTNCDAWAHGSSGENSDFGPTKNPWNRDCVPGGSSSGSGASVASNFALAAMATDTCGSVRLPASYCGVVGLKPTYGVVSRYGVIAMASSLDTVGHITRTVADSRKIFNVTKGEDGKDSNVIKQVSSINKSKKIKIGIPKEYFIGGLDRQVEEKVREAIKIFKQNGAEIVEVSLPHTKYAISVYYIIQPAEVSSNLARFDGIRYGNGRDAFGAEAKRRIMLGTYVLSAGYYDAYYLKAMKVRAKIVEEVDGVFDKVDVLMAPVAPTPPFGLGEKVADPLKMYLTDIFAATANLSGIPSIAIPSGFTRSSSLGAGGLPLGFQLMGPRFGEDTLFELGEMYQKNSDWHLKEPKLI